MKLRLYICFILGLLLPALVYAEDNHVEDAVTAYTAGDYKAAIDIYENVLDREESADLYYNLANAYYKDAQNARAILNYERALLLNPGHKDARFNLELARLKVVDNIEPVGEFFLVTWKNNLQYMMSVENWGRTGIFFFIAFTLLAVLFVFSRVGWLKKVAFFAGLTFFVFAIISNLFAYSLNERLTNRDEAIIMKPSVTAKSSPDQSGTDLFVLHDGTKVRIRSYLGDWTEIELENGNVGWLPGNTFEII